MNNTAIKLASKNAGRSLHPALEALLVFLRLGLTSFGGPVAHIGYFRREIVARRAWVDEGTFVDLVALCQFLPGPGSSQLCFVLGLLRGGWLGALAACTGFTLPSAILLFAFARIAAGLTGSTALAAIHGLKIVAVTVVAHAIWGMVRSLTPDARRAGIALAAGAIALLISGSFAQMAAIALGGLAGLAFCRHLPITKAGLLKIAISPSAGVSCLLIFTIILFATPLMAVTLRNHTLEVFNAFYRTGALVFGGGHVVLPLLRDAVVKPGWISENSFLTGYGAAQAIPGPLFTVSAYLGAALKSAPNGFTGAAIAVAGIFLPGMLLITGMLPFWDSVRSRPDAQAAIRGVNAAVVGILAAALYDPLWKTSIAGWRDVALASAGFLALAVGKAPPLVVAVGTTAVTIVWSLY
jgi:chromate transporter